MLPYWNYICPKSCALHGTWTCGLKIDQPDGTWEPKVGFTFTNTPIEWTLTPRGEAIPCAISKNNWTRNPTWQKVCLLAAEPRLLWALKQLAGREQPSFLWNIYDWRRGRNPAHWWCCGATLSLLKWLILNIPGSLVSGFSFLQHPRQNDRPQINPCAGWPRLCKASTAAGFTRDMGCHTDLFFFPPTARAWLGLAGRHHSLLNPVRDELLEWRQLFFSCLKPIDNSSNCVTEQARWLYWDVQHEGFFPFPTTRTVAFAGAVGLKRHWCKSGHWSSAEAVCSHTMM